MLMKHIHPFPMLVVILLAFAGNSYGFDAIKKRAPAPLKPATETEEAVKKQPVPAEAKPARQAIPVKPEPKAVKIPNDKMLQVVPKEETAEESVEEEYPQGEEYSQPGDGWYYGDSDYGGGWYTGGGGFYYYPESGQGYEEGAGLAQPPVTTQKFRGVGGSLLQQQRFQFREEKQGAAGASSPEPQGPLEYEKNQVLVATSSMDDAKVVQQSASAAGFRIKSRRQLPQLGMVLSVIRPSPDYTIPDAVAALRQAFPQILVAPNHTYHLSRSIDAGTSYAKKLTGWPVENSICRSRLRIGLIDTEVNIQHEALKGAYIRTRSMVTAGIPKASPEHGTAIAALLTGRSSSGKWQGLLNGANLYVIDVFRRDGNDVRTNTEWLLQALDALLAEQVAVINISLGGPQNDLLHHAVRVVLERQVILVAAAGDKDASLPSDYPAKYPGVIGVTAVDEKKRVYNKANHGNHIDFAAPGVAVWSAKDSGGGQFTGTSYATPFVTAAVAMMRDRFPGKNADQIVERLASNAIDLGAPGRDPVFGWGLLKADTLCGPAEH